MHHIAFTRKITTQSVLAFILVMFGMALVMLALFMPPKGEIHPSVITVFGMLLVAAGAFLGIDLNFQFKSYINTLQANAAHQQAPGRTVLRTKSEDSAPITESPAVQNPKPSEESPNT